MKTITIKITGDGKVEIATEGFVGAECKRATVGIESALGTVSSTEPTAESKAARLLGRGLETGGA